MNEIIINDEPKEEEISPETKILNNTFINSFISFYEDKEKNDSEIPKIDIPNIKYENIPNIIIKATTPKNKIKYNAILKYKKELNLSKKVKKFHLFNYECKNPNDERIIYKLGKVLLFTYRKNFPKITNYKTKKTYTTDAWWGCMIRCGQMILSRGIYLFLKSKGMSTEKSIEYTVPLFNEYPITNEKFHPFFHGMIDKYNSITSNNKLKVKEFFPPFCIKTLCDIGEIYERTAGEWFSDVIITRIFQKIADHYNLFSNKQLDAKIMIFQSYIDMPQLLKECFIEKKKDEKNKEFMHLHGKYYYFNKMGIVFVNVRIGLDKIPPEYYQGIKELFKLKSCIGIIGGKARLAYYFIGYNDDENSLLYLDPHVTKDSDKEVNQENILGKHINKEIHLLKMTKMSTAFTIGFCFTKYSEFLELFHFWQMLKLNEKGVKILGLTKEDINYVAHQESEEDIAPTYIDKDEDDF